eukprot:519435_1
MSNTENRIRSYIMKSVFAMILLVNVAKAPCVHNAEPLQQCVHITNTGCTRPIWNCMETGERCIKSVLTAKEVPGQCCETPKTDRAACRGALHGCPDPCTRSHHCADIRNDPCTEDVLQCTCKPKPIAAAAHQVDFDDDLFYDEAVLNLQIAEEGMEFARALKGKKRAEELRKRSQGSEARFRRYHRTKPRYYN